MAILNHSLEEQILIPLRELYRQDTEQRKVITRYANNFKLRGSFLRKEADFLQGRLLSHDIDFDLELLPVKLLTVELVPSTCWFSNVRDNVSRKTWDLLRKSTYKQANYKCEICDGRGDKWPVECHEIWHYDDSKHIQTLSGLIALCPSCHQVKHIGLAGIQGHAEQAENHLAQINAWGIEQTNTYLESVWNTWEERNCHNWNLDLSYLETYGIQIDPKR